MYSVAFYKARWAIHVAQMRKQEMHTEFNEEDSCSDAT
jgi:hypothetical protein